MAMSFGVDKDYYERVSEEGKPRPFCKSHPNDILDPCQVQYQLQLHTFGNKKYPLPFYHERSEEFDSRNEEPWGDVPRTIVELRMCALSSSIRDKPHWHTKFRDPEIRAKWTEEALEQTASRPEWNLTPKMVNYVLDELEGYEKLLEENTGIQVGCYERVWKSDVLVPTTLRDDLLKGVARLEDVAPEEQDWHPGSDGKVLDLVHPSLYPLVYDSTLVRHSETGALRTILFDDGFSPIDNDENSRVRRASSDFMSEQYAWIPSDFHVSDDGKAKLVSPYINNLDPRTHSELYSVIDRLVTLAVPMFERVLSDLTRPMTKLRMVTGEFWKPLARNSFHAVECIWEGQFGMFTDFLNDLDSDFEYHTDMSDDGYEEWLEKSGSKQKKRLPEALAQYPGSLDRIEKTISLSGQNIQIIVKLANIVLTPEKPQYDGGSWHVEGMENEQIVSTLIYYYDEENLTESRLSFRTTLSEPPYHQQDDNACMAILYDIRREEPLIQIVGSEATRENRCIAFPNIYHHQVQPFELNDKTKPGHRKIVAFFLVNPDVRIPSASDVPPQQMSWREHELASVLSGKVPAELSTEIALREHGLMTRERAEEIREKLMKERSQNIGENMQEERFGTFNMCEH